MRKEGAEQMIKKAYLAKISSSKKTKRIPQCDHYRKPCHEEKDCWHKGKSSMLQVQKIWASIKAFQN